MWLPNFPITAWWDGDVRFFGCNHENESSPCHCRMIFHKGLYWKAMEAPEKLSSDEQRWKTTGYGVSFSSSSTLFRDNRILIYSALLVLILACLYLHLLISCWECGIFRKKYSITKLSLSIVILNLFQIKQYTRTSTWNLNCPRCVFSSRLNIRLAAYLKTT